MVILSVNTTSAETSRKARRAGERRFIMENGYVSVCPFCVLYKKCSYSPCLYPLHESTPYSIRKSEYADIAEICLSDKIQASENRFSGEQFSNR